jgi:hypothetical protein
MAEARLKLYRGLSATEFQAASKKLFAENRKTWRSILEHRVRGDFNFPKELDKAITVLHTKLRFEHQYFTDSKSIAEGYAKKVSGIVVEVSVPLNEVIKYFDIEFQNFGRRKKCFEIVYGVKGSILAKFAKSWGLRVRKKK